MQVSPPGRGLAILLWSAQILIAVSFCGAGAIKLGWPIARLAAMWPWAGELSPPLVRLLGAIDIAGGAGILLPTLTGIRPRLALWAAAGCIALQVSALAFHAARGELAALPVNLVFVALAGLVLWGRGRQLA